MNHIYSMQEKDESNNNSNKLKFSFNIFKSE